MEVMWWCTIIDNEMHLSQCPLGVKLEVGSRLAPDLRPSLPADGLIVDWEG